MKCIVETKGDFTYLNTNGDAIHHFRPTVTLMTGFIQNKLHDGVIRSLASNLPKTADDEVFAAIFAEVKDKEMAVKSFCAMLGVDPSGDPIPTEEQPPKAPEPVQAPLRTRGSVKAPEKVADPVEGFTARNMTAVAEPVDNPTLLGD